MIAFKSQQFQIILRSWISFRLANRHDGAGDDCHECAGERSRLHQFRLLLPRRSPEFRRTWIRERLRLDRRCFRSIDCISFFIELAIVFGVVVCRSKWMIVFVFCFYLKMRWKSALDRGYVCLNVGKLDGRWCG